MSEKDFDLLVFVGRFQPPHLGHLAVIKEAFRRSKNVLVLVGSSNRSRSPRDPFTFDERAAMLRSVVGDISHEAFNACSIAPLNDYLYNDSAWTEAVQDRVRNALSHIPGNSKRVGIIGHSKDHTSYYLRIFPGYECVDVDGFCDRKNQLLNSTDIRHVLYRMLMDVRGHNWKNHGLEEVMPKPMIEHLVYTLQSPELRGLIAEVGFINAYQKQWKDVPYPPTFNTVDAVVQCCGNVLMIMRGKQPGAGKFALPGGFIGQTEPLLDACVRELYEETQLALPRPVVLGSLHRREPRVFDDPHRSSRGRTITHAYRFDLSDKTLPKVRGGDDAASALWVPISGIRPEQCFEDHAFIIRAMLGVS